MPQDIHMTISHQGDFGPGVPVGWSTLLFYSYVPSAALLSSCCLLNGSLKKQPSKIIIFFFSPMVISYRRRSHTGVWEMIVTFVSLVFCKITSTLPVVAHLHISHFKDVHWMFVGNVHNVFLFFFSFNHSVLEAHIFLPYILCSSSLAVLFASALD